MIFLRYESFRVYLRMYPVTVALIALNVIYFIVIALTGSTTNWEHLFDFGGFITNANIDPYGMIEPWRYVTSMFMHSGFTHLLFNMFSLVVFAPPLERLLGSLKYFVFYMLCGVLANAFSAVVYDVLQDSETHLGVGASGAIYGIYGAFLFIALFRKSWLDEASRKTVYTILGFGIIYSIVTPQVSLWGHIGGGLAGFLLYSLFDRKMTRKRQVNEP